MFGKVIVIDKYLIDNLKIYISGDCIDIRILIFGYPADNKYTYIQL